MTTGYARVVASPDASGGQAARLTRTTTINGSPTTAGASRVVVTARGESCQGAPQMVLRVDGNEVLRTSVPATAWTAYGVDVPIAGGEHSVTVGFTNDFYSASVCDRNLQVDKVEFVGSGPAPTPTPTPTPAPAPASVFTGDFETGGLSQWSEVQRAAADRVQIVQAPARQGRYAARYEVRNGDSVYGGARAETLWGGDASPTLREGDDYYFGWSTYWATDFPSPSPSQGHSIFLQWKNTGTGSPPMEMSNRNERIALRTNNNDVWYVPLTRGVWHDFVAHVKFSADPAVGYVEIWHNGTYQGHYPMATLISGKASYLKLGYYRNSAITPTGVLYSDAMRVGRTLADVKPW